MKGYAKRSRTSLSVGDAGSAWSHVEPLFAKAQDMDEYRAQVAGSVAIEALVRDANEIAGVPFARIVAAEEIGIGQPEPAKKGDRS